MGDTRLTQAETIAHVVARPGRRWRLPAVLGPTFRKDLWAFSRRRRTFAERFIFVLIVGAVVYLAWLAFMADRDARSVPVGQLAELGTVLFNFYVWAQFVIVCFLAPMDTADLVASERRAGTLDLLFVTDLNKVEIFVGAYLSRMFRMQLLVLAGLPVVMCVLLFGGASPWQLVQAATLTCAACLLAGAIGLFFSTRGHKRGVPSIGALLVVIALYSNVAYWLVGVFVSWRAGWQTTWRPWTLWHFWVTPSYALATVAAPGAGVGVPGPFGMSPWAGSLVFSLVGTLVFVAVTVLVVRRTSGRRSGKGTLRRTRLKRRGRFFWSRKLGRDVVFWREMTVRVKGRTDLWIKVGYVILVFGSYVYLMCRYGLDVDWNEAALFSYLFLECLVLFVEALGLASRAIAPERTNPTFVLMLATPLSAWRIVLGKVRAILRQLAVFIIVPIIHVTGGVVAGVVSPQVLVTFPASLMVAVVAFVAVCVFLSLHCRKVKGVVGWVLLVAFLLNGGLHFLGAAILEPIVGYGSVWYLVGEFLWWVMWTVSPVFWVVMSAGGAIFEDYMVFNESVDFGAYLGWLLLAETMFVAFTAAVLWRVIRRLDVKLERC